MRNVVFVMLLPALLAADPARVQAWDTIRNPRADYGHVPRARPAPLHRPVGTIDTVGGTTMDWQLGGPMARYLINSPAHGLHVTWMYSASNQSSYPDRNMRYNFLDYSTGEWQFMTPGEHMESGINVFVVRAGFGALDACPASGVAYVSSHVAGSPGLKPILARDNEPGTALFEFCDGAPNANGYLWPMMAADGTSAVHFALIGDDGERSNLYYSKVEPWCNWSVPISITGSAPEPVYPCHNIAASKASRWVTVVWLNADANPVPAFYRSSPDGGTTWEDPLELPLPPAYGGDTLTSFHITSLFPFYDSRDQLHIVAAVMPYVGGQGFIIPAQLWHWCAANTPNWNRIHTAEPDGELLAPVGYNALFACRVNIGEGADSKLYVAWEQFKEDNVEPRTDLLRADIYLAGSGNNGHDWGEPVRLTEPDNTSKRFPSIVDRMVMKGGVEYCVVRYYVDEVAGFHVQGQGPATDNPIVIHWLPTSEIPTPGVGTAEPGRTFKPLRLELTARPNPFGSRTGISYALPRAGEVSLVVYDLAGRPVRTLVSEPRNADRYTVYWDGRDDRGTLLPAGTYFCRLAAGQSAKTSRLTLVR